SIEAHARVLERTGAYIGLALESRGATEGRAAGALLAQVSSSELFREGYAQAAALKKRAHLMLQGWGGTPAKAMELIDAPLRARVAALLLPRPLYLSLDPAEAERPAADFGTLAQVDETRATLELCETLGEALLVRPKVTAADIVDEERRPFE